MTVVETWDSEDLHCGYNLHYTVNDCLEMMITRVECLTVSVSEFETLIIKRLAPLIWLAMPCHDEAHPQGLLTLPVAQL